MRVVGATGGSSGFGAATAERLALASAGLALKVAHLVQGHRVLVPRSRSRAASDS